MNPGNRGSISSIASGGSVNYPSLLDNQRPVAPTRQAPLPPGMEQSYPGAYQPTSTDTLYDSACSGKY